MKIGEIVSNWQERRTQRDERVANQVRYAVRRSQFGGDPEALEDTVVDQIRKSEPTRKPPSKRVVRRVIEKLVDNQEIADRIGPPHPLNRRRNRLLRPNS